MTESFRRTDGTSIWFGKDAVVLVDSKGMPLGRKIKTAIPKEVADMYPQVASIAMRVI
jgi:large subunit ribosomal protein L14